MTVRKNNRQVSAFSIFWRVWIPGYIALILIVAYGYIPLGHHVYHTENLSMVWYVTLVISSAMVYLFCLAILDRVVRKKLAAAKR